MEHSRQLLIRCEETLTTEDVIVVPPEVCQLGWSVVEFISVGCQDEPGRGKFKGSHVLGIELHMLLHGAAPLASLV